MPRLDKNADEATCGGLYVSQPPHNTVPIFLEWWHLGRTVSLSPIETAKAFGAPGLSTRDSNAEAKAILKTIRGHEVPYGASMQATPERASDGLKPRPILHMGDAKHARNPNAGGILVS